MARRRTIEVPGLSHGFTPIPVAAVVSDVLVSGGIAGRSVATGRIPESLAEQCTEMFANVRRVMAAAGGGLDDVVSMRVYMVDRSGRETLNHEWLSAFPDPENRPARHTLTMPLPEAMLIQCEITAVLPPEAAHES
jgi:2-iminobutanoate/2-iminopropanoate deaminase